MAQIITLLHNPLGKVFINSSILRGSYIVFFDVTHLKNQHFIISRQQSFHGGGLETTNALIRKRSFIYNCKLISNSSVENTEEESV